jgi:hypothetical protein
LCGEAGVHVRSTQLGAALTDWFEQGLAGAEAIQRSSVESVLRKQAIGRVFDSWFHDIQ